MPTRRFRKKKVSLNKRIANIISKKTETKIVQRSDTLDVSAEISNGTPFSWADVFNFAIPEGTGEDERIGDELELQSLIVSLSHEGGAADISEYRMLVVYFPTNDGAGFETGLVPHSLLPKKEDVDFPYKVLLDKKQYHSYTTLNSQSGSNNMKLRKYNIPVKGLKVQYDSGATTINRGSIKCFLLTNSQGNNSSDIKAIARIRYKDM